ncbi:hypothetical protein [Streptomyces caniscabiei]|uniref:hypothetical protein n=1 Tax=Streptomyces caniscabiei TaxID=2746961 RepID=UPI00117D92E6|nr:hypothetical protein [Streptomyces caniscabiei]
MSENSIHELLTAVRHRIAAFTEDGTRETVLSDDALELAESLLRAERCSDGEQQLAVALTVGYFRLARYMAQPEDDGYDDIAAAVEQFAVVERHDRSQVPETLPYTHALALLRHSESSDDAQGRDQAINRLRQIRSQLSGRDLLLEAEYNLGVALWRRFTTDAGDPADLDESIIVLWQAAALAEVGTPQPPRCLSSLAVACRTRFNLAHDDQDLDAAVAWSREAVASRVPGDSFTPMLLSHHGMILSSQYDRTAAPKDLTEAEAASRRAIAATPPSHPERPEMLRILSATLGRRYDQDSDQDVLNESVSLASQAERLVRERTPKARVGILMELATQLGRRFALTQVSEDLERAIDAAREVAQTLEPGHRNRPGVLADLFMNLRTRFELLAHDADLDDAIAIGTEVVEACAEGDRDQADLRIILGVLLLARFERTGNQADLEGALSAGRIALDGVSDSSSELPRYQLFVLSVLRVRSLHTDDLEDLEAAIALGEAVVDNPTTEPGDRVQAWTELALTFRQRFDRLGDEHDVELAVKAGEQALALTPESDPMRAERKNVVGMALLARSRHSGDIHDLNAAVERLRASVDDFQPDQPGRAAALANLGVALSARFTHTGNSPDLGEAIRLGEQAEAESRPNDAGLASTRSELARSLLLRFEHTKNPEDLDQALRWAVLAADHTPKNHFLWTNRQCRVLNVLQTRVHAFGDPSALATAIDRARTVNEALGPQHHSRPVVLSSLGALLLMRYERDEHCADVEEALELLTAALREESLWSADWARIQSNIGTALMHRFTRQRNPGDLTGALAAWREAAESPAATSQTRMEVANWLGSRAADNGRWDDAFHGYDTAVRLLPLLAWRGTSRATQENSLAQHLGLASRAASCAITAGQLARSVELLEHGRSVLWSQYFETRADFNELSRVAPDLADALDRVRNALAATGEPAAARPEVRETSHISLE